MQEWKKELCREQPETLQELGKGTYIQRRNITPYAFYKHDRTQLVNLILTTALS